MSKYHQGKFTPLRPEKYIGDVKNIVYRSGWELSVMQWLDKNPSILKWGSEELIIAYIHPLDNMPHRYYPDFITLAKQRDGTVKKIIIEIKPDAQTKPPVKPKRMTKRYLKEVETYAININKWKAATEFAKKNNFEFKILTEHHIDGIK